MNPARTIIAVVVAAALAPAAANAAEVFDAKVVAVHGGDTLTVLHNGHDQVRIRVEGIDCPELGQAYGRRAKQFTSGLVFGRVVTVRGKERDQYGRLVARAVVDVQDISHSLVKAG